MRTCNYLSFPNLYTSDTMSISATCASIGGPEATVMSEVTVIANGSRIVSDIATTTWVYDYLPPGVVVSGTSLVSWQPLKLSS